MELHISNCNNISSGIISISENRLNIKYAINGTGKSTLSKAIESSAKHDDASLRTLLPFQYIGDNTPENQPSITGIPENTVIAVFDENYVNQYVFLEDELLKNSFEIFIKTVSYDQHMAEINRITARVCF